MRPILLFLLAITCVFALVLKLRYGGGEPYPDLSTPAMLAESALEEVLHYPEPIGNVAVSPEGRIFFTVHPESRPQGNKLLEWVSGAAMPYPDGASQPHLFDTVLGIAIDRQERLWTIDNGNHGFATPRLIAFDLADGRVAHDHRFTRDIAPRGSFLQDLQVSADGGTVFIADASVWRKTPALIVYDVASQKAKRVLESHESVTAQDYLIRNPLREMTFLNGLVSLKAGIDGIALDPANEWLYYGPVNHGSLSRVRVADLTDDSLAPAQLASNVEHFSDKPLSDGLSADLSGNIYITDVEHGAVMAANPERKLATIIRSPRIRWADALSFGPDGWLYLADSAIPVQVLQSREHILSHGPFFIFRFRPGATGVPGH